MERFIPRPTPEALKAPDDQESGPIKDVEWYIQSGLNRKQAELEVLHDEEVRQGLEETGT